MGGNERSQADGDERGDAAKGGDRGSTGAGAEAAEGLHSTKGRDAEERSGVDRSRDDQADGSEVQRSGSEPLHHREVEHKSGYGGEKANPKTSSDQR